LELNFVTFISEVEDLPPPVQEQLFEELLDKDAQQQLESEPPVLNWSLEVTVRLGSRLYALWNRSAGDCLLDSAMQATWGVFDRDNTLRRALAESLHQGGHV
jgi:ubiquitin thioesterase ZRANB1